MRWPAVFAALCLLAACARGNGLNPDQAVALAGWVEDVARGRSRDPDELAVEDAGSGLAAAAAWLRGAGQPGGATQPPEILRSRAARWPELGAALAAGAVVTVPGLGLVAPRPGLGREARARAEALADGENLDRRTLDRVLAGRSGERDLLLRATAAARDRADAEAGGRPWTGGR